MKVVTLMLPPCTSFAFSAFTISLPDLTIFSCTSTPCALKIPFSAPTIIGRWPRLSTMTNSSFGGVWAGAPSETRPSAAKSSNARFGFCMSFPPW